MLLLVVVLIWLLYSVYVTLVAATSCTDWFGASTVRPFVCLSLSLQLPLTLHSDASLYLYRLFVEMLMNSHRLMGSSANFVHLNTMNRCRQILSLPLSNANVRLFVCPFVTCRTITPLVLMQRSIAEGWRLCCRPLGLYTHCAWPPQTDCSM